MNNFLLFFAGLLFGFLRGSNILTNNRSVLPFVSDAGLLGIFFSLLKHGLSLNSLNIVLGWELFLLGFWLGDEYSPIRKRA